MDRLFFDGLVGAVDEMSGSLKFKVQGLKLANASLI